MPEPPKSPPQERILKQKYLFECSRINFAWGYSYSGFHIDNQGKIYKFEYQRDDKHWAPVNPKEITERELEEKYNHGKKLLGEIAPQELLEKFTLIETAKYGKQSSAKQTASDAGALVLACFDFDEVKGSYRVIELAVEGDRTYGNRSPAAKELSEWLTSLKKKNG